jgi:hypothetical protein
MIKFFIQKIILIFVYQLILKQNIMTTIEKMPLSSSQADDIIFANFRNYADLAVDHFLKYNSWCQSRSDAWCMMMDNYDVEFVKTNGEYKSMSLIPKN